MQRIGRVREGESVEHQSRFLFAGIGQNGKFFIEIQQLMQNLTLREKKLHSLLISVGQTRHLPSTKENEKV